MPYPVFVGFNGAFNSAHRVKVILTLEEVGVSINNLDLLAAFLDNKITINDKMILCT